MLKMGTEHVFNTRRSSVGNSPADLGLVRSQPECIEVHPLLMSNITLDAGAPISSSHLRVHISSCMLEPRYMSGRSKIARSSRPGQPLDIIVELDRDVYVDTAAQRIVAGIVLGCKDQRVTVSLLHRAFSDTELLHSKPPCA